MHAAKLLLMGFGGALVFFVAGWPQPPKEIPSAVTSKEMQSYLAGEIGGQALPAETFGYPNPQQVLAYETALNLTSEQKQKVEGIQKDLRGQIQFFGRKIVTDELFLDNFFRQGETDFATLYNVLERIGGWRMRLRLVCLNAYLKTRTILSAEQLKKYHELRVQAPGGASSR